MCFFRNRVIDPTTLCLVSGQLVRVVYLDAVCLNDSGNSFDTALLACMLALKNGKTLNLRFSWLSTSLC
jgi:exosome complex RNA-binding protein Rrp42 (RNase PH superfamily)